MSVCSTMVIASAAIALAIAGSALAHDGKAEAVAPKFDQAILSIPGNSFVMLEVEYALGGASVPHTHAKSTFSYAHVISGEIESKVNDAETSICKTGRSWSGPPNATHAIGRNLSRIKPLMTSSASTVVNCDDKALGTVYGYLMPSGPPTEIAEVVRLCRARISTCEYDCDLDIQNLIKKRVRDEKLALVQAPQDGRSLFGAAERVALAWAERAAYVAETMVQDNT